MSSQSLQIPIYENWIKKQIHNPLYDIKELLEINLKMLNKTLKSLEKQIIVLNVIFSNP